MSDTESTGAIGRPRGKTAVSHKAILAAVYDLLKEMPARELTMDAIARRAKVGKPTLYRWWPSKASLVMAMFKERLDRGIEAPEAATAEKILRAKMSHLIREFKGLFGKVVADLIAEGQGDPLILKEFYERHIRGRRASIAADIERGIASGEFLAETNPEFMIDAIFTPVYYRLLLRYAPLTGIWISADRSGAFWLSSETESEDMPVSSVSAGPSGKTRRCSLDAVWNSAKQCRKVGLCLLTPISSSDNRLMRSLNTRSIGVDGIATNKRSSCQSASPASSGGV